MAVILRKPQGSIQISECDGKLVCVTMGKTFKALGLEADNDAQIRLWEAYKDNPDSVEATLNEIISERAGESKTTKTSGPDAAVVKKALGKLINFFSEFKFTPSFRFTNTLCHACKRSLDEADNYIVNYFKLMDSSYAEEVANKIKSTEFRRLIATLADNVVPTKTINTRLKIFYGAQGTGKTTEAMKYTNTAIVCNSAMQPCDLIEDFTFDDGKATFHPSALVKAMEKGETVLLDEMNLLPFDSLRFLQGICDGKENFEWKGNTIHIHDGFNIIGTMNLVVNGTTFGLPEPIVDRCSETREFTLTADQLMGAI